MSNELETYRQKAEEAILTVFRSEYHNSLGIPFPKVKMLLPDDDNYSTGQYYIKIDQTWQICLNFGLLPKSFKQFQDEVKVLTRHEVEHYMCCPFDVITHFRMLKIIRDTYNKNFANLGIDINRACASIANQAADIIVDTKNYFRHPKETLKSEIDWIKKGADLNKCPRHCKLMFLTKEAIWGQSLDINETNHDLLDLTKKLSLEFLKNGIDDKESFLGKTEEYANVFFSLCQMDSSENSKGTQRNGQRQSQSIDENSSASQNGSCSSMGSSDSTGLEQEGQDNQSDIQNGNHKPGQPGKDKENNQNNNGKPSSIMPAGTPKDGDKNGSAFVFADSDKIKEALEILANETKAEEFIHLLEIAGIGGMSRKEKERIWFSVQSADIIPIEEYSNRGSRDTYAYPSLWRIGDSIEDIDLMLSLMNSPMLIPGVTTKKWEMTTNDTLGVEKKQQDLLLVVDTSGSMGNAIDEKSNIHQAIKAAYGIISYFEQIEGKIALLGFSDTISADVKWTKDYNSIRDNLLINGHGGTKFPIKKIESILDESQSELVTVLITDGELSNMTESVNYFRQYMAEDNKLYIFLLGKGKNNMNFSPLKEIGAHIYSGETASEFSNLVISDLI